MSETRQRKGPERLAVVRNLDGTKEIATVTTTRTDWKATAADRLQTIRSLEAQLAAHNNGSRERELAALLERAKATLTRVWDDAGHWMRRDNGEPDDLGDDVVDTLEQLRNALAAPPAPTEGEGT